MITFVCGLARCGTTMAMEMLRAGGIPPYHDQGAEIGWETRKIEGLPDNHAQWLPDAEGMAVKLIDPHRHRLPQGYECRFIWMRRDFREQVRSQIKFNAAIGNGPSHIERNRFRQWVALLKREHKKALRILRHHESPLIVIRFEDVLSDPDAAARVMGSFVGGEFDAEAAASRVIARGPKSLTGLLEVEMLQKGGRSV